MSIYLLPAPLSENLNSLSKDAIDTAHRIDEFIVENEKTARHYLKSIGTPILQNKLIFHLLNEHTTPEEISALRNVILQKKDIGVMSEAGCPGIADPGAAVVALAHENNVEVIPLVGPSSILLALMGSGMNGQSFVFHGYLPKDSAERRKKVLQLEKDAKSKKQSQIFIETPYRNNALLADIVAVCSISTLLCIATQVTSKEQMIKTKTIGEWKKKLPDVNKKESVFVIG
jgi:16S rRNA (cytidine1402-2'-O)-methyltransferase